uniref:FoP_duplication domain-containing protein n=1 Tax=Meloidogyne hapla TaxID=6305 RepID=A0A1I8BBB5_MELHA
FIRIVFIFLGFPLKNVLIQKLFYLILINSLGQFARCFSGLTDCHRTVRAEREEVEAKKRQFHLRTLFNQRRKEGSNGTGRGSSHSSVARVYRNGGRVGKSDRDFEAIVNMLQTGELFSEELSRLRTSVRIKGPTTTTIVTVSK